MRDPYLWLEEVESEESIEWARAHNTKTKQFLENQPSYPTLEREVRSIVTAEDRLPWPNIQGNFIYNYWNDQKNPKGIWRRKIGRAHV